MRTLLLAALLAAPAAALDVPFLSGRVVDEAGLLSEPARSRVEAELKGLEERTGHQVAVLTIPELAGETLEGYSLKVARAWKLGRKGQDDGVLVLIAKRSRQIRIEVGYGLEPVLPDALAGRIIRSRFVPRFREFDFDGGVSDGVAAITAALEGREPVPTPEERWTHYLLLAAAAFLIAEIVLIFTTPGFIAYFAFLWLWSHVRKHVGAEPPGWFDILLFAPLFLLYVTGRVLHMLGIRVGGKHGRANGFWSPVELGGSGGSGGGGGFSGGGGSFGGGGASGSW